MVSNATLLTEAVSTLRERTGDPGETTEVDVRTGETDGATEAVAVAVLATVTEGDAATAGVTVATGVAVTVIVTDGITDATPVAYGVLVPTGTCAVAGNAPPWRMTATADRDASRTGRMRFMARRCGIALSTFCGFAATSMTQASGCQGSGPVARETSGPERVGYGTDFAGEKSHDVGIP